MKISSAGLHFEYMPVKPSHDLIFRKNEERFIVCRVH